MLEATIERDFKKHCLEKNVLCLKMVVVGDNGYPDRMVIGHGFNFFVEFKRSNCYPTSLQKRIHSQLRQFGQDVYCFNTPGQAQLTLDIFLCGITPEYMLDDRGITTLFYGAVPELTCEI